MKRHLNTLFVTTQGAYLSKDGETITIKADSEVKARLPIHSLNGIVCFGNVGCSPYLMGFCAERDVSISFLTEHGRFLAKVQGPVSGNVLLRREQHRRADNPDRSADIAKTILIAKIANSRSVLNRLLRDHSPKVKAKAVDRAIEKLTIAIQGLKDNKLSLDTIRGIEGEAASTYFGVFDNLITAQKSDFVFDKRNRRPPLDRVNCLLSFAYTLLMHDVRTALEIVGLDPAVGFLHRDRPGRYGLALDLMEEFRPILADRLVLSLINLCQVNAKGFVSKESGAVLMDDETRKKFLVSYQTRKDKEITHPFLKEKITIGLLPWVQALLLARHLRGDIDGYPPFVWK